MISTPLYDRQNGHRSPFCLTIALSVMLLCVNIGKVEAQTATYGGRTYTPANVPRAKVCNCPMCRSIRAQWSRTRERTRSRVEETTKDNKAEGAKYITKYRTEYKTERYRVKHCNGRRCWYEWRTRRVKVRVPYRVKVPEPKPEPKPEPDIEPAAAETVKTKKESSKPAKPKELIPSPPEAVGKMLDLLDLDESSVLIDAGCGDGRILIEAARRYGCTAIGIEIDPEIAEIARRKRDEAGVDRVYIFGGDATEWDYADADAVVIYQMSDVAKEIADRIPAGTQVVSYAHKVGPAKHEHTVQIQGERHSVYATTKKKQNNPLMFGL